MKKEWKHAIIIQIVLRNFLAISKKNFPNENSHLRFNVSRFIDYSLSELIKIRRVLLQKVENRRNEISQSAEHDGKESGEGKEKNVSNWIMLRKRNEAFAINSKYYDIMSRFHPSLRCQIIWYQIYVDFSSFAAPPLALWAFMWQQKINNLSSTVY